MIVLPTVEAIKTGVVRVAWTGINAGDTCAPVALSNHPDKTVQIKGTVTTFALQGSNNQDASNPDTLTDVQSGAAITAAGSFTVKENPLLMLPLLTTGSGVTVVLVCKRL